MVNSAADLEVGGNQFGNQREWSTPVGAGCNLVWAVRLIMCSSASKTRLNPAIYVAPQQACELQQMLINVRGHRNSPTTHVDYECCGGAGSNQSTGPPALTHRSHSSSSSDRTPKPPECESVSISGSSETFRPLASALRSGRVTQQPCSIAYLVCELASQAGAGFVYSCMY